jgi:hypothetical protein
MHAFLISLEKGWKIKESKSSTQRMISVYRKTVSALVKIASVEFLKDTS